MPTVGSYEAKTRLPQLLRSVEQGETVTITRRGLPIARIVGVAHEPGEQVGEIIRRMRAARAHRAPVSTREILEARDQGRRG